MLSMLSKARLYLVGCGLMVLGPISLTVFHHNSNLMGIPFCSNSNSHVLITTTCCKWHDSCALVACAKNCSDLVDNIWIIAKQIFRWIWILRKNHQRNGPQPLFQTLEPNVKAWLSWLYSHVHKLYPWLAAQWHKILWWTTSDHSKQF